jgi:hypothetical protein
MSLMMMKTDLITPPPELVEQWYDACILEGAITYDEYKFAAFAAQWGADQELEACCEWLDTGLMTPYVAIRLRSERRPKPPSLKRVALLQLDTLNADLGLEGKGVDLSQIRRALEALDD